MTPEEEIAEFGQELTQCQRNFVRDFPTPKADKALVEAFVVDLAADAKDIDEFHARDGMEVPDKPANYMYDWKQDGKWQRHAVEIMWKSKEHTPQTAPMEALTAMCNAIHTAIEQVWLKGVDDDDQHEKMLGLKRIIYVPSAGKAPLINLIGAA